MYCFILKSQCDWLELLLQAFFCCFFFLQYDIWWFPVFLAFSEHSVSLNSRSFQSRNSRHQIMIFIIPSKASPNYEWFTILMHYVKSWILWYSNKNWNIPYYCFVCLRQWRCFLCDFAWETSMVKHFTGSFLLVCGFVLSLERSYGYGLEFSDTFVVTLLMTKGVIRHIMLYLIVFMVTFIPWSSITHAKPFSSCSLLMTAGMIWCNTWPIHWLCCLYSLLQEYILLRTTTNSRKRSQFPSVVRCDLSHDTFWDTEGIVDEEGMHAKNSDFWRGKWVWLKQLYRYLNLLVYQYLLSVIRLSVVGCPIVDSLNLIAQLNIIYS